MIAINICFTTPTIMLAMRRNGVAIGCHEREI